MRELVAVYGTLKQGRGNHRILETSQYLGDDWVSGFKLYESGIPFAVPTGVPEDRIKVEVYEVTDPDVMDSLDWLEGHPVHYKRKKILPDEWDEKVWVYTYPHDVSHYELNETGVY